MDLLASEEGLHPPKQPIFDHYFELFALLRMNQSQAENSVLAFHFWHQYTQGIIYFNQTKTYKVLPDIAKEISNQVYENTVVCVSQRENSFGSFPT